MRVKISQVNNRSATRVVAVPCVCEGNPSKGRAIVVKGKIYLLIKFKLLHCAVKVDKLTNQYLLQYRHHMCTTGTLDTD